MPRCTKCGAFFTGYGMTCFKCNRSVPRRTKEPLTEFRHV